MIIAFQAIRKECRRIGSGRLRGPREFFRLTVLLWAISAVFFGICGILHPSSCEVSILDDTISHFGKPDKHDGSLGFLAFHIGFATLCLFMFISVKFRHRQLAELPGDNTPRATQFYAAGILGLVLSLIFPDTKMMALGPLSYRKLHGLVVVVGIFCLAAAVLADTKKLWTLFSTRKKEAESNGRTTIPPRLRPVAILASLFGFGLLMMGIWEVRCHFDPTLDHWPGDGIFSTALWEWIVFTYFVLFMFWYTLSLSSVLPARGGIAGVRRWRID